MLENSSSFLSSGVQAFGNISEFRALQGWSIGNPFFDLFPHRFDYIHAPHPDPDSSPQWQTESRHPLTDRLLLQGAYLYGVRFGAKTNYCLLDIDAGSVYHPATDPLAVSRILAALELLGLTSYIACTSSYSSGLHLYLPFQTAQNSWEIGTAVSISLEAAGFVVKPGQLEVFPNRKSYSVQGKPNLFNAHRLPLQAGSYLLNRDFEPVWSDRASFASQWRLVQNQNQIETRIIRQVLKQSQRQHYQVSGKAAKFLNDLNAEIELGWTGAGQTNYLLGRITMRTYIFHHILEGEAPLTGQALVDQVVSTARLLPGYTEWCQHRHEIEHRAAEWASCIENSRYFHYGDLKASQVGLEKAAVSLTWNQQQCEDVRCRIKNALADLLNQNALPVLITARFKLLTAYGISGSSLYRHKDLWHPRALEPLDSDQAVEAADCSNSSTSLFPLTDCNPAPAIVSSPGQSPKPEQTGCNHWTDAGFGGFARPDLECCINTQPNFEPPVFKPP